MYNVKNLVTDLAKVCGCDDKAETDAIKKYLSQYCNDSENAIDVLQGKFVNQKRYLQ